VDFPKYVVLLVDHLEVAFIFNPIISHDWVGGGQNVVGAGFCSLNGGDVSVWGESFTLDVKSRSEDAAVIKRSLSLGII
jgi:hypothetical protein